MKFKVEIKPYKPEGCTLRLFKVHVDTDKFAVVSKAVSSGRAKELKRWAELALTMNCTFKYGVWKRTDKINYDCYIMEK